MEEFEQIVASDLPDIEKLACAFQWIMERSIHYSHQEIELLKVLGDERALVKEQIKLSTLKHAQDIFQLCYMRITGRKAWNEQGRS